MGNDLKQKILEYNGIISPEISEKKPSILNCPRCNLVNVIENKYCSKCSYPLVPSAFEEIKMSEELKINQLNDKYEKDMDEIRSKLEKIISSFAVLDNPAKQKVAESMIRNGIYVRENT
jgi:hypothetical protein